MTTIYTAEADAAFQVGHWARAAALYQLAMDAMPQRTRAERRVWSAACTKRDSAASSAAFVKAFSHPDSTVRVSII